jgi:hypothetical protein
VCVVCVVCVTQHTNNTRTTHEQHTNNTRTTHEQHTSNTRATHINTVCGLFMPPSPMINAVIIAVRHECWYSVFVGCFVMLGHSYAPPPTHLLKSLWFSSLMALAAPLGKGCLCLLLFKSNVIQMKPVYGSNHAFSLTSMYLGEWAQSLPALRAFLLPLLSKGVWWDWLSKPTAVQSGGHFRASAKEMWSSDVMSTFAALFTHWDIAKCLMKRSYTGAIFSQQS